MREQPSYRTTTGLLLSMVALLIWYILSSGAYSIATGSIGLGLFQVAIAIVLGGSLWAGDVLQRGGNRPVPFLAVGFVALIVVLIAMFQVQEILHAEVMQLGEIHVPDLVSLISASGYLLLTAIFLWQLVASIRARAAP